MKRIYLLILFLLFFGWVVNVDAAKIQYAKPIGLKCETVNKVTGEQVCDLGFNIVDGSISTFNSVTVTFSLYNVTFSSGDIKLADDWFMERKSDTVYTFNTTKTTFDEGYHKMATITFHKDLQAVECYIGYEYAFTKIVRSCSVYQGVHYNKQGEIVTESVYEEECFSHYCEVVNGNYYSKSGVKVAKTVYDEECFPHYCEVVNDHYYGKDGTQVDQGQYNSDCTEDKKYCKIEDQDDGTKKYYDKQGTEVNKAQYETDCLPHYCEVVGDTYYNKEGSLVEKTEYEKECLTHYCEAVGDTYYDSTGEEVEKAEYERECFTHYCEIVDNEYYDINGNAVSKDEYDALCGASEKFVCEVKDSVYYGLDGEVITKDKYETDCFKHSCEVIHGTYFDLDGKVIDKATYDKHCATIENPATGYVYPILGVMFFSFSGWIIYKYTKKHNKFI